MAFILGIETSCDETAAALLDAKNGALVEEINLSQEHHLWGGVVPEVAARAHASILPRILRKLFATRKVEDIEAVAVTMGPGLMGGLWVGAMSGKGIALALGLEARFYGINHLEAHALSPRIETKTTCPLCPFPYLMLLVSGGHTELMVVRGVGDYHVLGRSLDDAAGEAFDKTGRLLGLSYPCGAALEQLAARGCAENIAPLPAPLKGDESCNFSFSGLKTAMARLIDAEQHPLSDDKKCDYAAALQQVMVEVIADRVQQGVRRAQKETPNLKALAVAGGVAANHALRARLEAIAQEHDLPFIAPAPALCVDNAVMVAWVAHEYRRAGIEASPVLAGLDFTPRPRWYLG